MQASSGSDLFDLPLLVDPDPSAADEPLDLPEAEQIELPEKETSPTEAPAERSLGRDRCLAGALDTALVVLVPLLAVAGTAVLGVPLALAQAPAYALITLQASFVYLLFCLLFWSRTPGMQVAGLVARAADGGAVTVGQAMRRWLGSTLTVALLGLPALPALRGGLSLADRMSDTRLRRND